ncbi:hypothetical protein H634G_10811 [Metarhizium anisopliae BRIP 53293]|uniref:Uncharacterized protein n=1 Tax=Metarhizium anisopliae BRIP 53293 TaxID=1291518 RepID=A0A0D9NMR5_METAN|nr:hypothetical protein H634G_10811 [Metarhizium anisopliae BRIP 53293]
MAGIYTKLDSQVDLHGFTDADREAKTESPSAEIPVEESNNPDAAARDEKSTTHTRSAWSLWKWEIISIILGGGVIAVIVALLSIYENKALSEWRAPISINTVVAILTALFKGVLAVPISGGLGHIKWLLFSKQDRSLADMDRYDQASHGAWGSAILIFNQFRGRSVS